ncbi:MAG: ATP synthase F1 subunit epsilon [Acetobacteraceae bacterium]
MPVALEIVSPEKLLLSRQVDMAVVPGSEGDIGVLAGHAPMIIMLRGGVVSIYEGEQVTGRLFVSSGFAEITPDRCTVLADEAVPVGELVKAEAEARLAAAEAAYQALETTADNAAVMLKQELAIESVLSARAMVDAASGS